MKKSIDQRSKDLFTKFLSGRGFTNIQNTDHTEDEFYYLDITAEKNGKKYGFELKDKNCTSTAFGDIMCDVAKAEKSFHDLNNDTYDYIAVVNFYTDKCFAYNSVLAGHVEMKYVPSTTSFGCATYDWEPMWILTQKKRFEYTLDGTFTEV